MWPTLSRLTDCAVASPRLRSDVFLKSADSLSPPFDGAADARRQESKGVEHDLESTRVASDLIRSVPVQSLAILRGAGTPSIGWGREGVGKRWRPRTKNSEVSDLMSLYRGTSISVLVSNDEHYQVLDRVVNQFFLRNLLIFGTGVLCK
jgi:hypothetical protein